MSFDLFNYSINIVSLKTAEINYGMTCAWAMQVDYEKIALLLGAESVTGQAIRKGSTIGLSCLNESQRHLATKFAIGHSNEIDKYLDVDYVIKDGAILIKDATVQMIATVLDIIRLPGIEEDFLIYAQVNFSQKNDLRYLTTDYYNGMIELETILEQFEKSEWDLISKPTQKWLIDRNYKNKEELLEAIKKADIECGKCGCQFDGLYKKAISLLKRL